jgi:hypothetical protein
LFPEIKKKGKALPPCLRNLTILLLFVFLYKLFLFFLLQREGWRGGEEEEERETVSFSLIPHNVTFHSPSEISYF